MNVSEFVSSAVKEKMEIEKLSNSQEQFIKLFDMSFKQTYEQYHKQLMLVLNRIEFNTKWLLKQQDIFMQHLKVPKDKEDIHLSIIDHPITEIAHYETLKDIRKMSSRKKDLLDE